MASVLIFFSALLLGYLGFTALKEYEETGKLERFLFSVLCSVACGSAFALGIIKLLK